eukprot:1156141-Pelagomonas_calceolata.AAC.2
MQQKALACFLVRPCTKLDQSWLHASLQYLMSPNKSPPQGAQQRPSLSKTYECDKGCARLAFLYLSLSVQLSEYLRNLLAGSKGSQLMILNQCASSNNCQCVTDAIPYGDCSWLSSPFNSCRA